MTWQEHRLPGSTGIGSVHQRLLRPWEQHLLRGEGHAREHSKQRRHEKEEQSLQRQALLRWKRLPYRLRSHLSLFQLRPQAAQNALHAVQAFYLDFSLIAKSVSLL
jgi:hypothetical protein